MATAQTHLRDLLRDQLAPVLRSDGYGGSGQNFHRQIDGNWAAVNVQRHRDSTATELSFTLNLGTASTAVRLEDGYAADDPVPEAECHWRMRVGQLLPGGHNRWWTVRAEMLPFELDILGQTIASHVTDLAVPRIAAMASDEAILGAYLDGEPQPGMWPRAMDVVGPILRRLGPPQRFHRYLEVIDHDGAKVVNLYTLFDDYPTAAMGPARIARRLERLSTESHPQMAILDLGHATPTESIRAAKRPFLDHESMNMRFAAAQALGLLVGAASLPRLLEIVSNDSRLPAVHAAFALTKLDPALPGPDRGQIREAIGERRARAVGSDRAALSELLRKLAVS